MCRHGWRPRSRIEVISHGSSRATTNVRHDDGMGSCCMSVFVVQLKSPGNHQLMQTGALELS